MAPQLCLGTVQFGLAYGITNTTGKVAEAEVIRILDLAARKGISLLDTAQAYGVAEAVLGKCWPHKAPIRLISKLPAQADPGCWEIAFQATLKRLNADHLDGFLLHRSADLLGLHAERLISWLKSLRERGLVLRLGVSIYAASELEGLPLDLLQLVQLPLSLYDQRLLRDGTVAQLNHAGIAVHARSVLLQGLLLKPADQWPSFFSIGFRQHHLQLMRHLKENSLTLLDAALSFLHSCAGLEAAVVGVLSVAEFAELLNSWESAQTADLQNMSDWAWENAYELDPRHWRPI